MINLCSQRQDGNIDNEVTNHVVPNYISEFQKRFGATDTAQTILNSNELSYSTLTNYTCTTYYTLKIPLKHLCDVLNKIPLFQRAGLRIIINLHYRSSTLMKIYKFGQLTGYTANSVNRVIPFNVSVPDVEHTLEENTIDSTATYVKYPINVLDANKKDFELKTTLDIATSSQPEIQNDLTIANTLIGADCEHLWSN
jgi:hypothetical protein